MSNIDNRFFQFIAGPRNGEVVLFDGIVEEDGLVFVEFKDKSRCNEDLIVPLNSHDWEGKLVAEVSDPHNIWRFNEEWVGRQEEKWAKNANDERVCVQEFIKGRKKITPVPPRKVASRNFGSITRHVESAPAAPASPSPEEVKRKKFEGDPVWGMMEAAKKFTTTVSVDLDIMLPKKSLYDVADESFENGGEKVIEYIIENLDISLLKDALKESLFSAYGEDRQKYSQPDEWEPSDEGIPIAIEEPKIGAPEARGEMLEVSESDYNSNVSDETMDGMKKWEDQ
jgi:hypothetical protein